MYLVWFLVEFDPNPTQTRPDPRPGYITNETLKFTLRLKIGRDLSPSLTRRFPANSSRTSGEIEKTHLRRSQVPPATAPTNASSFSPVTSSPSLPLTVLPSTFLLWRGTGPTNAFLLRFPASTCSWGDDPSSFLSPPWFLLRFPVDYVFLRWRPFFLRSATPPASRG